MLWPVLGWSRPPHTLELEQTLLTRNVETCQPHNTYINQMHVDNCTIVFEQKLSLLLLLKGNGQELSSSMEGQLYWVLSSLRLSFMLGWYWAGVSFQRYHSAITSMENMKPVLFCLLHFSWKQKENNRIHFLQSFHLWIFIKLKEILRRAPL